MSSSAANTDIHLLSLIESRIGEIILIEKESKRKQPKLYSQRLPRFMRRRAASHNIKRLPKYIRNRLRPNEKSATKDRTSLIRYRRRLRHRKHKRVLRKHVGANFNNPMKCLLHKWFAKRFKMGSIDSLKHVPIHNSTKNQRNLYRQSLYGCAYISMANLIAIQLQLGPNKTNDDRCLLIDKLEKLNMMTNEPSGFTFFAIALEKSRYEVTIKLFDDNKQFICNAFVYLDNYERKSESNSITIWVPRNCHECICDKLNQISKQCKKEFKVETIMPKDWTRIRLLGPNAHQEALRICDDIDEHKLTIEDTLKRCKSSFGFLLGRHVLDKHANFTYFNTNPESVDIVFKGKPGRLLWYKLTKNRAHLVGGQRDLDRLCP